MKAQRWLFIFAGICVLFLAAGCSGESTIDTSVPVRQEIDAENDVDMRAVETFCLRVSPLSAKFPI